ncbi:bifunctional heptose 7-phosphate kinase/heptose 1-phosphate adenyltransferase [Acidobacteriota bacterium]
MDKNRLNQILSQFPGKKVAVWGDIILDEYVYGNTRRISREAPVLIISYKDNEFALGGAGNAILNIKALGAIPIPISILGQDEAGDQVISILKSRDIYLDYLIRLKNFQTPQKTRVLAGEETARKQQILRIDRESSVPDTPENRKELSDYIQSAGKKTDALLISDYHYFTVNRDVFSQTVSIFKEDGQPVSLDSRFRLLEFPGISVTTPNEPEVEEALKISLEGDGQAIEKAGTELLDRTQAEAVLITRGSKGMSLFENNKPLLNIPIHGAPDIVDVTGAGDTVISVLTLALTCGASFQEAAFLANLAGGIVVMKKGTATLEIEELHRAIDS